MCVCACDMFTVDLTRLRECLQAMSKVNLEQFLGAATTEMGILCGCASVDSAETFTLLKCRLASVRITVKIVTNSVTLQRTSSQFNTDKSLISCFLSVYMKSQEVLDKYEDGILQVGSTAA